MQGLAHYAEHSPSPSPPPSSRSVASSSRPVPRDQGRSRRHDDRIEREGPSHSSGRPSPPGQRPKRHSPPRTSSPSLDILSAEAGPSTRSAPSARAEKRRKTSTPADSAPHTPLPENLTHTRQSDLPVSELSKSRVSRDEAAAEHGGIPGFPGLSEEEVFRLVTRPPDIPGVIDWGIPPPVDPSLAPAALRTKVSNFLRLKYERDQHINTTLLSSSAFANPHIYAKLVEFVQIDETATAFPGGGWTTRRGLEGEKETYGPAALNAVQKTKEEAVKKSQAVGKRSAIEFAKGKYRDGDRDRDRGSGKERDRRERDKYRERERERERNGGGSGSGTSSGNRDRYRR